jgi:hypothetical protein
LQDICKVQAVPKGKHGGLSGICYDDDEFRLYVNEGGRTRRSERTKPGGYGNTSKGGCHNDVGSANLSLYAPNLKLLNTALILALAMHSSLGKEREDASEAWSWLNDDVRRYDHLLRGLPLGNRRRFTNEHMCNDVGKLIDSGILVRSEGTGIKAWCKVFGLDEPEKYRRRLIIEPRDLNDAWKREYPRCSLPNVADVIDIVAEADCLTQGDLKCYFYPILAPRRAEVLWSPDWQ